MGQTDTQTDVQAGAVMWPVVRRLMVLMSGAVHCSYVEYFVACTIYHGVRRLGCPVVSQVKPMVHSPGFPPSIVWDNWYV